MEPRIKQRLSLCTDFIYREPMQGSPPTQAFLGSSKKVLQTTASSTLNSQATHPRLGNQSVFSLYWTSFIRKYRTIYPVPYIPYHLSPLVPSYHLSRTIYPPSYHLTIYPVPSIPPPSTPSSFSREKELGLILHLKFLKGSRWRTEGP